MTIWGPTQAAGGTDDAEEPKSGGTPNLTSSDLELDSESVPQIVGIRWDNVIVPKGATINSAYIQFQVDEVSTSSTASVNIYCEAADDPVTFTTATNNISDRSKTSASVPWHNIAAWNNIGDTLSAQKSPDLKTIVQEIVNRPGWSSGQAMVFLIEADSGGGANRAAETGSNGTLELTIDYTEPIGVISYVRSAGIAGGSSFTMDIGTAGTNRLVTVHVGDESTSIYHTAVTVDSKSCTQVHRVVNTVGAGNVGSLFYIDEDGLGSSNGSVTISVTGADSGHGIIAMLHTGVSQSGPYDSGYDNTSSYTSTITVTNIDCPANGVVISNWGEGRGSLSVTSITSPLTQRAQYNPSSADLWAYSAIEPFEQTNKTYQMMVNNSDHYRAVGIVATWAAAASGWSHKINTVTSIGKVNSVILADIEKINAT